MTPVTQDLFLVWIGAKPGWLQDVARIIARCPCFEPRDHWWDAVALRYRLGAGEYLGITPDFHRPFDECHLVSAQMEYVRITTMQGNNSPDSPDSPVSPAFPGPPFFCYFDAGGLQSIASLGSGEEHFLPVEGLLLRRLADLLNKLDASFGDRVRAYGQGAAFEAARRLWIAEARTLAGAIERAIAATL